MMVTKSMERMEATKDLLRKKFINTNLLSLKLLVFFFFGGMGCLFPFLPLHMIEMGLSVNQIQMVSMISPALAILGPLIAAPLADKLAGYQGKNDKSTGRYIRIMIAIVCILSAFCYASLVLIPTVDRMEPPEERKPSLKFNCEQSGAVILQEKCKNRIFCHRWSDETKVGPLLLKNCNYTCSPVESKHWHMDIDDISTTSKDMYTDVNDIGGSGDTTSFPTDSQTHKQSQEELPRTQEGVRTGIEPPHLCFKDGERVFCHVYTKYSDSFTVNVTLGQALNNEKDQELCAYPIVDYFVCRIPTELEMKMIETYESCSVECDVVDPHTFPESVLAESQCKQTQDWSHLVFWTYLTIRSVADIFPTTAVALINAAVVIATRETSCGRGDIGSQLAFGSLSFAIFGSLTGYLCTLIEHLNSFWYLPIGLHAVLMFSTAIVALCANGMPLSTPEWWWHTRSGMLALPMSAIKRYSSETAAVIIVLIIMGSFWSVMDSYLPLHLQKLGGNELPIGTTMTVGAVPAFLFLWKSEHIIDYCGHSNLLITAFIVYIIRFISLSVVAEPWWSLISESLEVFTLGIMLVTAILYMRHLIPRHLTVTGQALPIIAHFCVGRCIGAVIGAYVSNNDSNIVESLRFVYQCMAVTAAVVAIIYFILYHGLLKPRCHANTAQGHRQPPTIMQGMNGNGNYTPLRVYHNGMGRKGQFRY